MHFDASLNAVSIPYPFLWYVIFSFNFGVDIYQNASFLIIVHTTFICLFHFGVDIFFLSVVV